MNEKLKEMREAWKNLYGSLFKWIVLSGVIGSFIGLILAYALDKYKHIVFQNA